MFWSPRAGATTQTLLSGLWFCDSCHVIGENGEMIAIFAEICDGAPQILSLISLSLILFPADKKEIFTNVFQLFNYYEDADLTCLIITLLLFVLFSERIV
jgi:hypothetical protein